ncbi:MAG: MFS transporter [Gammaproteobacteria bacterium]|jgi:MHS family proline/betaine transporter-like MFS transporter
MVFHLPKGSRKTATIAGVIGNIIEWYDFALYGFMATILSTLFFPSDNKVASLLATYGVFAAGFVMRPIGSAIFGWLGDTIGRSKTMLISVAMMAIPTFALGLLPTYETAGLWAPVLLVTIRLIQGLSVGGEFSSSVTYLVETAQPDQRGLSGSWANVGSMLGMLLGSAIAAAATNFFDSATLHDWGWRLPFLFGAVLGITAIMLRRHLPHSEHFARHESDHGPTSPLKEALTRNGKQTLQGMLFASGYGALFYLTLVYLPNWLSEYTSIDLDVAMTINTAATALMVVLIPVMGWISDKFMRRTHLIAVAITVISLIILPLQYWMDMGSLAAAITAQFALAILIAIPCGVGPAMFVELFPTEDRLSGYSVAFNIGLGIIGGSTPMIATWLIDVSGSDLAPAFYLIAFGLLAISSLLWMQDRSREPLQ